MLTIVFDLDGTLVDTAPDLIGTLSVILTQHRLPAVPFVTHYAAHIADRSRAYPHVESALDRLAQAGYRLAVCTNKLEWLSRSLLDSLHLAGRFAAICGQDTFGVQKPDPEFFRQTVRRAGGDPERAIMVGDSATDIRTARAASAPVVAVDFGYTDVPVATLKPDQVISSFAALPQAVADLGRAKNVVDDQAFIGHKS